MKQVYSNWESIQVVSRLDHTGLTMVEIEVIDPSTDTVVLTGTSLTELTTELGTYVVTLTSTDLLGHEDRLLLYNIRSDGDVVDQGDFYRGGFEFAFVESKTMQITLAVAPIPGRNVGIGMIDKVTYELPFGMHLVVEYTYTAPMTEVASTSAEVTA